MRSLTANAQSLVATQTGVESVVILEIEWVSGSYQRYATKEWDNIPASLLNVPTLDQVIANGGDSAAISILLDDSDESFLARMNTQDVHLVPARLYQLFEGLTWDDRILIFAGLISSPIEWNTEDKSVSFDIMNRIKSLEVGFSPESGQFSGIPDDLVDQVWPLCFGSPILVPMVKATDVLSGTLGTIAGFPDATMDLKISYVQHIQQSVQNAYNYYNTVAAYIDSSTTSALTVRNNYITAIIGEDTKKQEREDALKELEFVQKRLEEYYSQLQWLSVQADRDDMIARIQSLRTVRDNLVADFHAIVDTLEDYQDDKKELEDALKRIKYLFDVADRLRQKQKQLYKYYSQLEQDLIDLNLAKASQIQLMSKVLYVSNGVRFPQGVPVNVKVGNAGLTGTFNGNIFNITGYWPTYNGVPIGVDITIDRNQFYVPDASINLTGMYCQTDTGIILRVTGQEGTLCTFEEIPIPTNRNRTRDNSILLDQALNNDLYSNLNHILSGNETEEQLLFAINNVPSELSREAWNLLAGGSANVQYLRAAHPVPEAEADELTFYDGTFTLIYDGYETSEFTSFSAFSIKARLLELPPFQHLDHATNLIEVELVQEDGVTPSSELKFEPYTNDLIKITFNTDLWGPDEPYPHIMKKIAVNSSNFYVTNIGSGTYAGQEPSATIGAYYASSGAQEHTAEEIQSIINRGLNASIDSAAITALKKDIENDFNKTIRDVALWNGLDAQTKTEIMTAMQSNLTQYNELVRKALASASVIDEALRLISEKEQEFLLETEVIHYVQWYRQVLRNPPDVDDPEDVLYTNQDFASIVNASPIFSPAWVNYSDPVTFFHQMPKVEAWVADPGTPVELAGSYQETFVGNVLPSTVHGVYGYRSINGVRQLVPVPSRYFEVDENNPFGPLNCTTVTFRQQPPEFDQNNYFIILSSSVGPNVADIISWIATNWTDLTPDTATFAAVNSALTNYPAHFALLDKRDALDLIAEIAWQARCEVWVRDKTLFIRYLSSEPVSVATITDSDIAEGSLVISYTGTEEVKTKNTGLWYATANQQQPFRIITRIGIEKHGEREFQANFNIFNNFDLVHKSHTFWAIYGSQVWKQVSFKLFHNRIALENMDIITINLSRLGDPVLAKIISYQYNPDTLEIDVTCWLPVVMGETSMFDWAFPSDAVQGTIWPSEQLVTSGQVGSIRNSQVPTGLTWDLTAEQRPLDVGKEKLSDADDSVPPNPALEYSVVDYNGNLIAATPTTEGDDDEEILVAASDQATLEPSEPVTIEPGQLRYGRVLSKNEEYSQDDPNEPTGVPPETDDIYRHKEVWWNVELFNGKTVIAESLQMHPDEVLPVGFIVGVTFDEAKGRHVFVPPIEVAFDLESEINA